MRIVVDTNVLVSGIFWKSSPARVLDLWRLGKYQLALSKPIFDEYSRILRKLDLRYQSPATEHFLTLLGKNSLFFIPPTLHTPKCDDPKDQMFLELAVCAKASYIVSGDDDLLRLREYPGGKIIGPGPFCRLFQL